MAFIMVLFPEGLNRWTKLMDEFYALAQAQQDGDRTAGMSAEATLTGVNRALSSIATTIRLLRQTPTQSKRVLSGYGYATQAYINN
jgi:hypothetical protein